MENFTDEQLMKAGVGSKEQAALKPAKVKIIEATIELVGEKKIRQVVCSVKHPEKNDPVKIRSVKINSKDQLKVYGLWVNLDEDGKLQKGSPLTVLMSTLNANSIADLAGKEADTVADTQGYLVFKAYS